MRIKLPVLSMLVAMKILWRTVGQSKSKQKAAARSISTAASQRPSGAKSKNYVQNEKEDREERYISRTLKEQQQKFSGLYSVGRRL